MHHDPLVSLETMTLSAQYSSLMANSSSFLTTMPILEEISEPSIDDSQTPDAPSNMANIEGSSNVTIAGSHLNNVIGPQNNTIYHGDVIVRQINGDSEERQLTLWDEFIRIRTGEVYIKANLCITDVGGDPDQWGLHYGKGRLRACRTIKTAHLTGKNMDVLYIGYSGDDAVKAFQKDFENYSRTKDANHVQLLGYTDKPGVPALIFYDGLIPVSFVWEKNGFSSLMYTYFSYLARQILDPGLPLREMWIDPRTGWLRKGPYVESSAKVEYAAVRFRNDSLSIISGEQPTLTLQEYNNTEVLQEYLFEFLSTRNILYGVHRSAKCTPEWANDKDAIYILSSLPGTVYSRTPREPIARWSGDTERWHYALFQTVPKTARERMVTEDGSVRLTVALANMQDLLPFWLHYELRPTEDVITYADTWLSLAHHIFYQLGIHRDEWEDHFIVADILLYCECQRRKSPQGPIDAPFDAVIYLFIHPIPRPSEHESAWHAWMKGKKYLWSFDPFGKQEISDMENEQRNLGLPSLKFSMCIPHRSWDLGQYDAIRMLHTSQGFDPISTAFARSFGYPHHRVEIINPHSGRFEDINNEEYSTDDDSERLSTIYEDETESWYTESDDAIQASTPPRIDQGQDKDNMDSEEQFITRNLEGGLDSVNAVDEPLRGMMGVDQHEY